MLNNQNPLYRWSIILSLLSSFLVFLDNTIVNLALPIIENGLHTTRAELEWVINAYALSFAAIMLGSGALTDYFGPKKIFTIGLFLFLFTSIFCAIAPSIVILNISRLFQGVGAALLLPSSLKLGISNTNNDNQRGKIVALWAAAGGIGLAVGPFLGGLLVNYFNWPSIFWANVIVCLVMLSIILLKLKQKENKPIGKKFDFWGQLAATFAIGGLVFGLIEAPSRGWSDKLVLSSFILMVIGCISFFRIENRVSSPLLPHRLYKDKVFIISIIQGSLFNFMFYGLLFALTFKFQYSLNMKVLISGFCFLPLTAFVAVGNLSAPKIASHKGRIFVLKLGQTILVISLLSILLLNYIHSPLWVILTSLITVGFSSGLLVPTMVSQTLSTVSSDLHGAASAAFNTFRQIGGAVGIAVFGPLLGVKFDFDTGITICILLTVIAIIISFILSILIPKQQ